MSVYWLDAKNNIYCYAQYEKIEAPWFYSELINDF